MRLRGSRLPLLLYVALSITLTESRRVRVQPIQHEPIEEETIQYYAAEPQDDGEIEANPRQRVVLVSSADQYNGLYGQPTAASSRSSAQDNYIPASRKALQATSRVKEAPKQPPVQTIRNYNKVNDDGSFTFGYEAADGSFKEETRGTDCVVRGKYGYIDPDGNKREFTYVSGNPCDPNAPKEDQDDDNEQQSSQESDENDGNVPANYPTRPIRPIRPVTVAPKPALTLFQTNYGQGEEEEPEPEQVLKPQPVRRPSYITRPQYIQQTTTSDDSDIYQRPQLVPSTTPASFIYKHNTITPVSITPRPVAPTAASTRTQLPATTYRPQLLQQVAVTPPRPSVLYTKHLSTPQAPGFNKQQSSNLDFDAEFQKFQQENNYITPTPSPSTPSPLIKTTTKSKPTGQIYSSALIFDPSSGQYKTQLYQTLPQTDGDFSLNQRIQPYVQQPQRQLINLQQLQQQSPLYSAGLRHQQQQPQQQQTNPQTVYQQQQAELQFQNSAQLFVQQQRARQQQQQLQQQQQQQRPQIQHPIYYIQPSTNDQHLTTGGQIDQFLRGHNIQF